VAIREVLEEHGVDVADRAAVFALLVRLPFSSRARVEAWMEYLRARGEVMSTDERARLSG